MSDKKYYLAVDIGASSGRHILGRLENAKIRLEEIYRFENKLVNSRTQGMDAEVYKIIPEKELYARNGIQKQLFSSIYQLVAIKKQTPELL